MESFEQLKNDMNTHAMQEYPLECVGIVTKDYKYLPCLNISEQPKNTFVLDPAALVENDGNIWGIFHSHPGEENPFQEYKFLVGFNNKFFIYWLDSKLDALIFDEFKEEHIAN